MTLRSRKTLWWFLAGAGTCVALAVKEAFASSLDWRIDPWNEGLTPWQEAGWRISFYLLWAALTPAIFASADRFPITRRRWAFPLAVHLASGIVVSVVAPMILWLLVFDPIVRGVFWFGSDLPWFKISVYRALADPLLYWMILAAGMALREYDERRRREQQAVELRRALVAAEVDALKMKLQPHFLFNTLNSIGFLAVERDGEGVVRMVQRLGALLRSSMQSNGRHLVTVGEELALLEQYLAIEEVRFADRLTVSRRISPGVIHALIPSLLLQPMIENSIKHGFLRRIDAGRLEIAIARERDSLVVTVEDDGPGLPAGWELATHCGRGLKNVIERLEKLYPGAWSFTLRNRPGGGAVSRLRLPWQVAPSLELLVLSVLAHCPRHGYEIGRLIERASGGHFTFRITTLYPALYRLENRRLIAGRWVERAGERRRCFYHLTEAGKTVLEEQRELWEGFVAAVGRVAQGDSHA